MVNNSSSIKVGNDYRKFLNKFAANRIVANMEDRNLNQTNLCGLIVKYFKDNNDRYLELINMENKNV